MGMATPVRDLSVGDLIKIIEQYFKPNPPLEDIIDAKEVARLLGYTEGSIRVKVCRRDIPYLKIGGKLRFRRSEIEQWILKGGVRP